MEYLEVTECSAGAPAEGIRFKVRLFSEGGGKVAVIEMTFDFLEKRF